jgi:hypothetical protein
MVLPYTRTDKWGVGDVYENVSITKTTTNNVSHPERATLVHILISQLLDSSLAQGCQMYLRTKNTNLGNFGGPWNEKYWLIL